MLLHSAFGGSTNLLLHIPAFAQAAGLKTPTVDDWIRVNRSTPRLVDALPNGPRDHPTVQVFMAGAVPEVMLHLRRYGFAAYRCADRGRRYAGCGAGLVGRTANAESSRGSVCGKATASTPMMSSCRLMKPGNAA